MMLTKNTPAQFDSTPLFVVKAELDNLLIQSETALSEYMDNSSDTVGLAEVAIGLYQSEAILRLFNLRGASKLCLAIAQVFEALIGFPDRATEMILGQLAEAIILLRRYLEFVQLQAKPAPLLLVETTNQLRQYLNQAPLGEGFYIDLDTANLPVPTLPNSNLSADARYQLLALLARAFRSALVDALNYGFNPGNLKVMRTAAQQMLQLEGGRPQESYWQLVSGALSHLPNRGSINASRGRTLSQIERQISHPDQPVTSSMLQNIMALSASQDNPFARHLRTQWAGCSYLINTDEENGRLYRQVFGPDREAVHAISQLLLGELEQAKFHLDTLARGEPLALTENQLPFDQHLRQLSSTLSLLNMPQAAQGLLEQSQKIGSWTVPPDAEQVNTLMERLLGAENAIILYQQSYTPGLTALPLNNLRISLQQLDQARQALIRECRDTLFNIRRALESFIESGGDMLNMDNVPVMLETLAGALSFLQIERGSQLMQKTIDFVHTHFGPGKPAPQLAVINALADALMAVEHYLDGLAQQKPVGEMPFHYGERSLSRLAA